MKFERREDSKYIYQKKLDKDCSQHDMAFRNFKD